MKKTLLAAVLLVLGMSSNAFAGSITNAADGQTKHRITATVYNDSGSDLTSGSVVIWDNDDTEFDRTGYPYVTTTTTADDDWVAGVTINDTCAAGALCEIVTYGWAFTRVAHGTDAATEDVQVATSSVAGQAGDWGAGTNTCSLGLLLEAYNLSMSAAAASGVDNQPMPVFVNPGCED